MALIFDRQLDDFYVTAAISSSTALCTAALAGDVMLNDFRETQSIPLLRLIYFDEIHQSLGQLRKLVRARLPLHASKLDLPRITVNVQFDTESIVDEAIYEIKKICGTLGISRSSRRSSMKGQAHPSGEELQQRFQPVLLSVEFTHKLQVEFKSLIDAVRASIGNCPSVLIGNSSTVRDAIVGIRQIDAVLRKAAEIRIAPAQFSTDSATCRGYPR